VDDLRWQTLKFNMSMVFLAALKMPPGAQFYAGLPPRDRGHFPECDSTRETAVLPSKVDMSNHGHCCGKMILSITMGLLRDSFFSQNHMETSKPTDVFLASSDTTNEEIFHGSGSFANTRTER
jgi:hypothetical protein